ncbi:MAG: hypothetical protein WAO52_14245 [Prolixibacteraceae bacterium]
MLNNYCQVYQKIWDLSSTNFPEFSKTYNRSEKIEKEEILDQYMNSIKYFRKVRFRRKGFSESDKLAFLDNTKLFLSSGLDFDNCQLEMMFSDELISASKIFIKMARKFDAELLFQDIFQALRNVWIMNGLQLIMGIRMKITPSVFAYSLLYPYTDNYIDDPKISRFEKMIFSERFRDRLSGEKIQPVNTTENAIFRLVELIENEYDRIDFPEVFESLLNIHEAQTSSIRLVQERETISESEIMQICLNKGGTSVLADGFLVAGHLSETQKSFLFGYGAYLQLLDDIQDVEEDFQDGLMTVFSKNAWNNPLDEKLNKTYWFGEEVMKSLDFFEGQHIPLFKSLMRKSMDLFIIEAIAQNQSAFSINYINQAESSSPFQFSYIYQQKELLAPYHGLLLSTINELAFSDHVSTEKSVFYTEC